MQARDSKAFEMNKGKVRNVGFFERVVLKLAGSIDGKRNLPKEDLKGYWISPHIDREERSYDEYASKTWGNLQIKQEEKYTRLGELMDIIEHTKRLLEAAKADLEKAVAHEKTEKNTRKHGEDRLTESQVISRRSRERAKKIAPLRNKVNSLQSKLTDEIAEFSELRNSIIEDINSTRMICDRVRDHLLQRIDVYWNAALHKHSKADLMPVIPNVDVSSYAESAYMEPHRILFQRAEEINGEYSDYMMEVE